MLDTCKSGSLTRVKGGRPTRPFAISVQDNLGSEGTVFITSSAGVVTVVAAARTFELLAENNLGEELSNASPAVAGDCLLLRTRTSLVCIGRGVE